MERSNAQLNLQKIFQVCSRGLPDECCQSRLEEELPIPQQRYWEVRGWGRLRRQRFKTALSDCMSCPSQLFEAIEKHILLGIFYLERQPLTGLQNLCLKAHHFLPKSNHHQGSSSSWIFYRGKITRTNTMDKALPMVVRKISVFIT